MKNDFLRASILLLLFGMWSCSKEREESSEKVTSQPSEQKTGGKAGYRAISVKDAGTVSGKVTFKGTWNPPAIPVTKDQNVCGKSKKDPSLIVSRNGEVRNAVVYISDISGGKPIEGMKPVLDQKGCEYHPHVLAFPVGTTLEILNSDGILHNIHSFSEKNAAFNKAQPQYLKKITETFTKPEIISIKCDVHGWMSGWLFVADNPYYEVTSDNGTFKLGNVPPGSYTLKVWHEKLGKQTKKVSVDANATVKIDVDFPGPVS